MSEQHLADSPADAARRLLKTIWMCLLVAAATGELPDHTACTA